MLYLLYFVIVNKPERNRQRVELQDCESQPSVIHLREFDSGQTENHDRVLNLLLVIGK